METFNLPDVGEGLTEAEITEWKVAVGDTVAVNDVLCEIETAKSLVELPSPYAGTVAELMVPVGETVPVGTPIIGITTAAGTGAPGGDAAAAAGAVAPSESVAGGETGGEADDDGPAPRPGVGEEAPVPADGGVSRGASTSASPGGAGSGAALTGSGPKADATRRRPRRSSGTGAGTAAAVPATTPAGRGGTSTAASSAGAPASPTAATTPTAAAQPSAPAPAGRGRKLPAAVGQLVAAGRERQAEAAGLFERVLAKPPVRRIAKELGVDLTKVRATGQFGEVTRTDVEDYLAERETNIQTSGSFWMPNTGDNERRTERIRVKGVRKATAQAVTESYRDAPHVSIYVDVDASRTMEFVQRLKKSPDFEGIKVTPLLILAKAVIWAAARNPHVNASWTDEEILVKHYMNLGIAAATPRGLLVPNIKDANELSLKELAMALTELAKRARDGKTQPAEMADGTISITNIGALGIDTGTPIINRGEVAIVAFGTIRQKPWVVSGEVIPRWITTLGGSFDHRVVDGDLSARFMADVAAIMEEPALLLE
ncbi:2-oxo acid dehydrogenase subunit E2 [Citricoccus sp. SGAir0253]|uniref:dihydrolipoamide acetyltransferase family protein n=1 Tax=Citricoccus sp. SGAir0253 TaxID=2567881 RepID=UPI0010CD5FD4|nr:dihydrolipoamide acetyltransferase family protein [Citricoccus sp. SGAir0253]QCU77055.1 2-oxo acid dehydrogenase subunit E2 [Citricoccus sp. SGAir0253]